MKKLFPLLLLLISFSMFSQDGDTLPDTRGVVIEAANMKHIVKTSNDQVADIVEEFYRAIAYWPEPIDFESRLRELQAVRVVYADRKNIGYIQGPVIYINAYMLDNFPYTGKSALLRLLGEFHGMPSVPLKFKYNEWSENLYTRRNDKGHEIKMIMNKLSEIHPLNHELNKTFFQI